MEEKLNASAWDILSAIQAGFRAQVDVKGKLAELFMSRQLVALKADKQIDDFEWQDVDGQPDFIITFRGRKLRAECKNIRSGAWKQGQRVELQKTRNSKDGTNTRGYKCGEFDVLGACLFNQTGKWDLLYTATKHLTCRPKLPDFWEIMQAVPPTSAGHWTGSLLKALVDATDGIHDEKTGLFT